MAVSLWGRYDWVGQERKWERGRAETCPTESARARRLRTGYCTQQIWNIRSMKKFPVLRQPHNTLLEYWSYLQCVSNLPVSMGIQKVWDSCKCDKSFGFLNSISDLSFFPPVQVVTQMTSPRPLLGCAFSVSCCLPVPLLLVKLEHPSFCLLEYREIVSPHATLIL